MYQSSRGMSLVDVIVGVAITLAIFLALLGILKVSLELSAVAKAQVGATVVANTQMEYVRSLDYQVVGTVGGIPSGVIPQYATSTLNGIQYVTRSFVSYVDSPKDGSGVSDSNGITTDYKQVKIEVSYYVKNARREVEIGSTVVPPGIETSEGGGTLSINVVDAVGAPLSGATVQVVNASTSPTINLTTYSDVHGTVLLGGAPTSTQYQVYVSKAGHSSAQTYARNTGNPNPNPGYLTVAEEQTTTQTFAIDELGELTIALYEPPASIYFSDTFTDATLLALVSSTTVVSGNIELSQSMDMYDVLGTAQSTTTMPAYLDTWGEASTTLTVPASTTAYVQVYDQNGTRIPDTDLPGNSDGFGSGTIDLSGLSTSTYSGLALRATLATDDPSQTPTVANWGIRYAATRTPVANATYSLTGAKSIGTTDVGVSLYKTVISTTTDSSGTRTSYLEYDSYTIQVSGYDVVEACAPPPFALAPASSTTFELYVGDATSHNALVTVRDEYGVVVEDADVTLERTGYSETVSTSACGTAYFASLTSSADYTLTASKTGYADSVYTNVSVSGQTYLNADFE